MKKNDVYDRYVLACKELDLEVAKEYNKGSGTWAVVVMVIAFLVWLGFVWHDYLGCVCR